MSSSKPSHVTKNFLQTQQGTVLSKKKLFKLSQELHLCLEENIGTLEHSITVGHLARYCHPEGKKFRIDTDERVDQDIKKSTKKMLQKKWADQQIEVEIEQSMTPEPPIQSLTPEPPIPSLNSVVWEEDSPEPVNQADYLANLMRFSYPNFDIEFGNYEYPRELKRKPRRRIAFEDGPFGSQWVHEKQVDDSYTPKEDRLSAQYDLLRAIVLPEQRSPEWFAMRRQRITASDGGCVLGKSKYDAQYTFIVKKVDEPAFTSNIFCYHGKKLEEIATMIYAYRMNVIIEEFGMMAHPHISFIGASPDGICNQYKRDGKSKSHYVGRMLEIKCPMRRKIKTEGEIVGGICPEHYWIQVQLQLECCDLDECDFWQCDIKEYPEREAFLKDTDEKEPFRSLKTGHEKGVLIQLMPLARAEEARESREKYNQVVYESASFIYPTEIEMSPYDCDRWIAEQVTKVGTDPEYKNKYYFDCVKYWRLEMSMNVTIHRDKKWFAENLPTFERVWNYVTFFREEEHQEKYLLWKRFIETRTKKMNKEIMEWADILSHPEREGYDERVATMEAEVVAREQKRAQQEAEKKAEEEMFDDYMFVGDEEPMEETPAVGGEEEYLFV